MGLSLYFFRLSKRLTIHAITSMHTITSPNTIINAAPPTLRVIAVIVISIANVSSRIVARIIPIRLLSIKATAELANCQIQRLSKVVSHRSLGSGFIFKPHIIWRIEMVG